MNQQDLCDDDQAAQDIYSLNIGISIVKEIHTDYWIKETDNKI
jgi:hypothetical protein